MLRFGDHFVDIECDTKDRVITRETAIPAIVDAFVGKIQRSEKQHRLSKILQRERAASWRDGFELLIGLRSDQPLESLNELRFAQSQIVQGFDKRHQDNFGRMPRFANPNHSSVDTRAAAYKKAAPDI